MNAQNTDSEQAEAQQAAKLKIASQFSQASARYDDYAQLQRTILQTLIGHLPEGWRQRSILDAGAGTGALKMLEPDCRAIGMDLAEGMCAKSAALMPMVAGDMEHLPFADNAVEGCVSSLAMQWLEHESLFFAEAKRVVKPQGFLAISTLTHETLEELKEAFIRAGLRAPLLHFRRAETIKKACADAGWSITHQDQKTYTTHHKNVLALMKHFKGLGANSSRGKPVIRHKTDMQKIINAYQAVEPEGVFTRWNVLTLMAKNDE